MCLLLIKMITDSVFVDDEKGLSECGIYTKLGLSACHACRLGWIGCQHVMHETCRGTELYVTCHNVAAQEMLEQMNARMTMKSPLKFIFIRGMSIKLLKNENMIIATKFRFGSPLCMGKILASCTSVVLNGNRLISFANECQLNNI